MCPPRPLAEYPLDPVPAVKPRTKRPRHGPTTYAIRQENHPLPRSIPMTWRLSFPHTAAWLMAAAVGFMSLSSAEANSALTRFPTVHGDNVVFEAYGNLWKVSRNGGTAMRLTSDQGYDLMPRYSPDGKWIAFTGQYQGNTDVYVIPADGGDARRLTFHSDVVDSAP